MISNLRNKFIADFSDEKYKQFLADLHADCGTEIPFHISETPALIPKSLQEELIRNAKEILNQSVSPEIQQHTDRSIPDKYHVSGEEGKPHFVQIDFALTEIDGSIVPRLIELQGFPTLYAFQYLLGKHYQNFTGLKSTDYLPGGLTDQNYLNILYGSIVGKHDPENVVLLEIHPEQQKTYCDFLATKKLLNIDPVCVTKVKKKGSHYFHEKNGRMIPIYRIYNRVIFDEWERKNIQSEIDFKDVDSIEWITHPNWYYRISKFILPYLNHPTVPKAYFVKGAPDHLNLESYVLKPLFSFAGLGVKVEITKEDINKIPEKERDNYILQEKVEYAPVLKTLDEPSKMEVRVMFILHEGEYKCVNFLIRLSKGKMMGVDFNKNKTWVGSSGALFEK